MKYGLEFGDYRINYRASSVHEFRNDVIRSVEDDGYRYLVDGAYVSRADALTICDAAIAAKGEKKLKPTSESG